MKGSLSTNCRGDVKNDWRKMGSENNTIDIINKKKIRVKVINE